MCTTGNAMAGKLRDAADIASGDQVGISRAQVAELAVAQARRDLRLQHVVGAGRAAADMRLRRLDHREAGTLQQRLRFGGDLLAVLQAAGGMIGDRQSGPSRAGA